MPLGEEGGTAEGPEGVKPAQSSPRIINPGAIPNPKDREIVAFNATMYRGPVPHPDIAAAWEEVCPGAADRLLRMAEKQSDHRQNMEKLALTSNAERSRAGLWTGFAIGVVALIVAGVVSIYGSAVVGGIIGVVDLVALVGVFVYGSQGQRKEREKKDAARQAIADGKNNGTPS